MKLALLLLRLKKSAQLLRSPLSLKAFFSHRVLAGAEHRHVLGSDLATIIDIGANRGQFALAAKKWAPKALVIAFEPLTAAAHKFRQVFRGTSGIIFHQAAIGPQSCSTTIHVSAADDSSSLLSFLPMLEQLFPGTREIRTERVKLGPLSDFVRPEELVHPAMLKMDVQGYELEALRGCENLLGRFSYIYAECSFVALYSGQALADDIIAWLRERGWCLKGIYNMTYDGKGRSIQADFLFENPCFTNSM